jgi:RNA polymerase sigma-70 factor (ECF subfamily)
LKNLSEKDLVQRCIEGSVPAWDEFVNRYTKYVYSLVFQTLKSNRWPFKPEDVEDITSQVFLSFLENDQHLLRSFEWRCSLKTWIWIVTRKRVIRYFRKKQHKVISFTELVDSEEDAQEAVLPSDPSPGPRDRAELGEKIRILQSVLSELPERERLALVYYFYEGASYAEIADLIGVKPHYVGTIIFRAKKLLEGKIAGRVDGPSK